MEPFAGRLSFLFSVLIGMSDTHEVPSRVLLDDFIVLGVRAYKRLLRSELLGRRLDRKEPVEVDGHIITGWSEYTVYRLAQWVQDVIPAADVQVSLDGIDSALEVSATTAELKVLRSALNSQFEEFRVAGVLDRAGLPSR